jgi:hypothetical protein
VAIIGVLNRDFVGNGMYTRGRGLQEDSVVNEDNGSMVLELETRTSWALKSAERGIG